MKYLAAVIFYPMLWMRGLVLAVGRLLSIFAILGALMAGLISLFTHKHFWLPAGLFAVAGFIVFLLTQLYDSILFRLNPSGRSLILYQ